VELKLTRGGDYSQLGASHYRHRTS